VDVVRRALDLPDADLVAILVRPPLELRDGRVVEAVAELPAAVQHAVDGLLARLTAEPFAAPEAGDLSAAGLGARELAAAVRSGQLVRIADGIYLAPGVEREAQRRLAALEQPFSVSQARQAWATTRRVAVPLMEWLDAHGVTTRLPDSSRRLS
jgi:selenocysteine-specific elongation factor